MARIESKEHMLQLDHMVPNNVGAEGWTLGGLSHAEGNWIDRRGIRWATDISMLNHWRLLDVSIIDKLNKTVANLLDIEGSLIIALTDLVKVSSTVGFLELPAI